MKYLLRAVKYYIYLWVILALVILILQTAHLVQGSIEDMFIHGYDSLWQMAIVMAVLALLYPRMGYTRRHVRIKGSPEETAPKLAEYMRARGYKLSKQDGDTCVWHMSGLFTRIVKMGEDAVTITRVMDGYEIEGLTKEVIRIDTALVSKCGLADE